MKRSNRYYILLFALAIIFLFGSCLSSSVQNYSSDAAVTAFGISNDSVPAMATTIFTIDNATKTIYNVDSLPYHTKTLKAIPAVTANSTSGIQFNDTTYQSGDTINFDKPVTMTNYAADGTTSITYTITVNVHKIDPDSVQWKKKTYPALTGTITDEKALWFNGQAMLFINNGSNITLYTSTDGTAWTSHATSGIPVNTSVQQMTGFGAMLYLIQSGNSLLKSPDGITWTPYSANISNNFTTLIGVMASNLWAVVQTGSSYAFAISTDAVNWTVGSQIPADFPVSGFTAVSYLPLSGSPKMTVIGGTSTGGVLLNAIYSGSSYDNSWSNFATETTPAAFPPRLGASVAWYDSKLLLMGGATATGMVQDTMLWSRSGGLFWTKSDSLTRIPPSLYFQPRQNASLFIDDSYRIWLIGGKNSYGNYMRDVWMGRKNLLGFGQTNTL